MEKNPFLARLMKDKSKDVLHSSAYAEAQGAGKMGAASTQSFAERQRVETNRTTVRGYKDSRVVNDALGNVGAKIKSYDATRDTDQRAAIRERFGESRRGEAGSIGRGDVSNDQMASSRQMTPPPARRNPGISR
ncbi:MAG: hypothetical protein K6G49_02680 [Candidatus Saccharibacteria bacterium]|nr:hypothetical protein [Candidatus Saccharibacteria bacterium]